MCGGDDLGSDCQTGLVVIVAVCSCRVRSTKYYTRNYFIHSLVFTLSDSALFFVKAIEEVEREVERLLRADAQAERVQYGIKRFRINY